MNSAVSSSSDLTTCIQWMWNADADPFAKSHSIEWRRYSDIENMIIEDAFQAGKTYAMLDNYYIDFTYKVQICNNDTHKQRPVKRMVCEKDDKNLREERFMLNPIAPNRPYGDLYGFISPFIKEVAKKLSLKKEQLPSKNVIIVPKIVEKAALGIIEEGKKLGKQREAEQIANKLLEKKDTGIEEVWKCCAYLYSLECFLYKKLNETMRLIGSEQHEQIWRSKINTLGPFCLLLWDNPFDTRLAKPGTILYRGADLSDELIASFKRDCLKDPKPLNSFQAFTSCSRNCSVAERFGNALFIMKVRLAFTVDLSKLSKYPHEEEELLFPGVCFTVDKVDFDKHKNKHLIYLILQQRHNKADYNKLSNCPSAATAPNICCPDNIPLTCVDDDITADLDDYSNHAGGYAVLGNDIFGALYYYGYANYPDRGANNALNAVALRAYYGDSYNPTRYIDTDKYNTNHYNPFLMTDHNGFFYDLDSHYGLVVRDGFDCDWE